MQINKHRVVRENYNHLTQQGDKLVSHNLKDKNDIVCSLMYMYGHAPKTPLSLGVNTCFCNLGFVYTYRQCHLFSYYLKIGSMQPYGAVYM